MSSSDIAVAARDVSKSYRIFHSERATTLGETISKRLRNPIQRMQRETFWALQDINFDIPKGDVVGIVGRNGAGKSTLLKVLSRITAPTTGEITVRGRVGSLLEVGTGFHSELSGRENIYLNGSILGMKRKEIDDQFDAIVDFSGVEKFLDTPVKRYSSGMYVRLAFSVAAHLNPEVLIVDEVLAVGDAEFQQKCMGKMQDVAKGGKTVLFVSHNMHSVATLCKSAMLLQKGCLLNYATTEQIIGEYIHMLESEQIDLGDHARRRGSGDVRVVAGQPAKPIFGVTEDKTFEITAQRMRSQAMDFNVIVGIATDNGQTVTHFESKFRNQMFGPKDSQTIKFAVRDLWLRPGRYVVNILLKSSDNVMDFVEPAFHFDVSTILPYEDAGVSSEHLYGPVLSNFEFIST